MNIYLSDGSTIDGGDLINAIYRTDLVPVPVTMELMTKATERLLPLLAVGQKIMTVKKVTLVIVKSTVINEQSIKAGRRIGAIHAVAVLDGFEALLGITHKATDLQATSFNEIYRALGARAGIKRDLKVRSFVCLKGQLPTTPIAAALQKEAAVIHHTDFDNAVSVVGLNELMSGEATPFDKLSLQWIEHPNAVKHGNTNFLSVDEDGTTILGQPRGQRSIDYYPRVDSRELQNLRRILITKATITRQLDDRLDAGKLIEVDGQRLVVLTAAHRYDSGTLGGRATTATKAWLAQVGG